MATNSTSIPFAGSAYMNTFTGRNNTAEGVSQPLSVTSIANKTITLMGILIVAAIAGGVITWNAIGPVVGSASDDIIAPSGNGLIIIGAAAIVTVILGIVSWFKRVIGPVFAIAISISEGILVGAISAIYSMAYDGIVSQALIATLAVCAVSVGVFKTGVIQKHYGAVARFLMIAVISYVALSLINLVLVLTGVWSGGGIWSGPMAVGISLFVVALGALMLSFDLTTAKMAVEQGLDDKYSWNIAFAIAFDVVWIYLEVLRLLAILNKK